MDNVRHSPYAFGHAMLTFFPLQELHEELVKPLKQIKCKLTVNFMSSLSWTCFDKGIGTRRYLIAATPPLFWVRIFCQSYPSAGADDGSVLKTCRIVTAMMYMCHG